MRINLHWGTSNLIVLTIIVAMLGMTQAAMAVHKPFPCWTCCPNGPLCANPDNFYYRRVVGASTSYTNTQVAGTALTSAQWNNLATDLQNWKTEADGNGVMEDLNLFFRANAATLEAPVFNMTQLVPAMKTLGYQGSWTQLAWAMNKLTQKQRIAMVQYVQKYGWDGVVTYAIASAQAIAKGLAEHRPFDMCGFAEGGAYWFGFAAAASALIGQEEVALPLAFIGGTFALGGYMGGCY